MSIQQVVMGLILRRSHRHYLRPAIVKKFCTISPRDRCGYLNEDQVGEGFHCADYWSWSRFGCCFAGIVGCRPAD